MSRPRVTEGRPYLASALIDPAQRDVLVAYAKREERSMAQLIRWAIEDWLVRHTPWRPPGREQGTILKKRPLA